MKKLLISLVILAAIVPFYPAHSKGAVICVGYETEYIPARGVGVDRYPKGLPLEHARKYIVRPIDNANLSGEEFLKAARKQGVKLGEVLEKEHGMEFGCGGSDRSYLDGGYYAVIQFTEKTAGGFAITRMVYGFGNTRENVIPNIVKALRDDPWNTVPDNFRYKVLERGSF